MPAWFANQSESKKFTVEKVQTADVFPNQLNAAHKASHAQPFKSLHFEKKGT
jgi:hypothetical protein